MASLNTDEFGWKGEHATDFFGFIAVTVRMAFQWRAGKSGLWQVLGILLTWMYVVILHWENAGLWYQGDAPRHAANGLFWLDFISHFPVNPFDFALGYYARYPVINPAAYPPFFYLIEAGAFSLFGPSPFIAKGLVLSFALLAAIYLAAWLRRWVAEEAGWGGALLVLQPGVILWGNAVLLNVPSMALGVAALYHARCWLEAPASRHIYAAAAFAVLGILTYFPSGMAVFVVIAWIMVEGRWTILGTRRALALFFFFTAILLPCAFVVIKWAPTYVDLVFPTLAMVSSVENWTFYFTQLPRVADVFLLGWGVVGILFGLWDRTYRREVKLLLAWGLVCYGLLSQLVAREPRYGIVLLPPLVLFGVVTLLAFSDVMASRLNADPSRCFLTAGAVLLTLHASSAFHARVPVVDGFQDVVAFFEKQAPSEMIFYDGLAYNGVFSFYMRLGDDDFRRGVVRRERLRSFFSSQNPAEPLSSPEDLVNTLKTECGCQWLAIEKSEASQRAPGSLYLQQAVTGPEFEFVKSFDIVAEGASRIDVYRLRIPVEKRGALELSVPKLGVGKRFQVKPIESTKLSS